MKRLSHIEKTRVNGVELSFSINVNSREKPLVLYLHGGPGDSCVPLTQKFNSQLDQELNFVNLEQRGAGLSYYPFKVEEQIQISTFIEDIFQFVKYLLSRFHRDKIILVGHSWGSVLGMKFIQKYPELVSKYIGVGQVVNLKKTTQLQKDFLHSKTKRLKKLDFDNDLISSTLYLMKQVVKHGGSLFNQRSYAKLIPPFVTTGTYSFSTLINRLRGSDQSIKFLWEELMDVNFEVVRDYQVPITFFEGRHDHHVPSSLVSEYAITLNRHAPIIWFEESGHFPQWEESERFNSELIKLCNE